MSFNGRVFTFQIEITFIDRIIVPKTELFCHLIGIYNAYSYDKHNNRYSYSGFCHSIGNIYGMKSTLESYH